MSKKFKKSSNSIKLSNFWAKISFLTLSRLKEGRPSNLASSPSFLPLFFSFWPCSPNVQLKGPKENLSQTQKKRKKRNREKCSFVSIGRKMGKKSLTAYFCCYTTFSDSYYVRLLLVQKEEQIFHISFPFWYSFYFWLDFSVWCGIWFHFALHYFKYVFCSQKRKLDIMDMAIMDIRIGEHFG